MKTTRAAFFLFATAALNLMNGCGCDAASTTDFKTASFAPSSTQARSVGSWCGDATYGENGSVLDLELVGETDVPPPYTTMTLQIATTAPVGEAIPLSVTTNAASDGSTPALQSASDSHSLVKFSLALGSNANEIDDSLLNSMTVTILSMPSSANAQTLAIQLQLNFLDGTTLDQNFQAPLTTSSSPCVEGTTAALGGNF